ncbi:MAG: PP2C family protein-serine/threonine phosphatase [Myxococcota bacterium]
MSLRIGASTHPGLVRAHNEDAYVLSPEHGFFAVIDGIGGQNAGEKAAALAQQELQARLERKVGTLEQALREAITTANNKIYQAAQQDARMAGMACVLSVAVIEGNQLYLGHVGDSRVYRARGKELEKLTHDHSPVGEREDRGELSELEAMRHPRRNEVYRDVGSELHETHDEEFIELIQTEFEPEDALVLCSDGLSDLVTHQRILQTLLQHTQDPQAAAVALIQLALQEGGKDNVTVIVVMGALFGQERGRYSRADEPTHRLGVIAGALDGQNPRLSGEQTGRLPGQEEGPTRNFKVISNPLRNTRERMTGELSATGRYAKGKPVGGESSSDEAENPNSNPRLRDADDETTGRRAGRLIQLPGAAQSGRAGASPSEPRRSGIQSSLKRPWLSTLPGWVLPLMLMVLVLAFMLGYAVKNLKQDDKSTTPVQAPSGWKTVEVERDASLEEAMKNAAPGTILLLNGGAHTEKLVLKSDVWLLNAGTDPVKLTAPAGAQEAVLGNRVRNVVMFGFEILPAKPLSGEPRLEVGIRLTDAELMLFNTSFGEGITTALDVKTSTLIQYGLRFGKDVEGTKSEGNDSRSEKLFWSPPPSPETGSTSPASTGSTPADAQGAGTGFKPTSRR